MKRRIPICLLRLSLPIVVLPYIGDIIEIRTKFNLIHEKATLKQFSVPMKNLPISSYATQFYRTGTSWATSIIAA
jgi:hypothetical protein